MSVLTIYCALILLASLVGGWVPLVVRLTHRRMQIALSFVAGVMLGVGLLHLLPQSFEELSHSGEPGQIDVTVGWTLLGFMLMFFLERFFHFHHRDTPDELISTNTLFTTMTTIMRGIDHAHAAAREPADVEHHAARIVFTSGECR